MEVGRVARAQSGEVRRYCGKSTGGGRGEYRADGTERTIDRDEGGEQNRNCNRELVADSGAVQTAPVERTAARERSSHDSKTELTSDCVSLHPPRPSGRNPHRPLIFLAAYCLVSIRRSMAQALRDVDSGMSEARQRGIDRGNRWGYAGEEASRNEKRGLVQAPFLN